MHMTRNHAYPQGYRGFESLSLRQAGVIQWQNRSFPSFLRGFDSLRPLHPPVEKKMRNLRFACPENKRRGVAKGYAGSAFNCSGGAGGAVLTARWETQQPHLHFWARYAVKIAIFLSAQRICFCLPNTPPSCGLKFASANICANSPF